VGLTRRALDKANIGIELVVAGDGQEALDFLWGTGAHAGRDLLIATEHYRNQTFISVVFKLVSRLV
jgi:hypothetical protein